MRRVIAALPALLLLLPVPAGAQHWNDNGPGRDLLTSTITGFDVYRQRPAAAPTADQATPTGQLQPRGPIPILDWTAPAAAAPEPRTARRTPPRRRVARAPVRMRDDTEPAPAPISAPAPRGSGTDWDRTFAERERELDRLRRMLEDDRARYERNR
jgi:hypothetical protein